MRTCCKVIFGEVYYYTLWVDISRGCKGYRQGDPIHVRDLGLDVLRRETRIAHLDREGALRYHVMMEDKFFLKRIGGE